MAFGAEILYLPSVQLSGALPDTWPGSLHTVPVALLLPGQLLWVQLIWLKSPSYHRAERQNMLRDLKQHKLLKCAD